MVTAQQIELKPNGISEQTNCVRIDETVNGNLLITVTDKAELIEQLSEDCDMENLTPNKDGKFDEIPYKGLKFYDSFEDIQCNSTLWYHSDIGHSGFGLTEAPGFTYEYLPNDSGDLEDCGSGRVWWFPNYMVEDFVLILLNEGRVLFHEAK